MLDAQQPTFIICDELADKITVFDTKPGLPRAFAEELGRVTVSLKLDVEIIACDRDEDIASADEIRRFKTRI